MTNTPPTVPEWAIDEALRRAGVNPDETDFVSWRDRTYARVTELFAAHIAKYEGPANARLTRPEATAPDGVVTYLLSLADSSNWPEFKNADEFRGYEAAMDAVHDYAAELQVAKSTEPAKMLDDPRVPQSGSIAGESGGQTYGMAEPAAGVAGELLALVERRQSGAVVEDDDAAKPESAMRRVAAANAAIGEFVGAHWPEIYTALRAQPTPQGELAYLEAEARRFAGFYSPGSDGRNTFIIFADKIAALTNPAPAEEAGPCEMTDAEWEAAKSKAPKPDGPLTPIAERVGGGVVEAIAAQALNNPPGDAMTRRDMILACRTALASIPDARQSDSGEVERLPRLDDGLIEAAMRGHYGKAASNIIGLNLTAQGIDWSFRDGFKRMWAGVRKELRARAEGEGHE